MFVLKFTKGYVFILISGSTVSGSLASARHLCRLAGKGCQLYGGNNLQKAEVRKRERERKTVVLWFYIFLMYGHMYNETDRRYTVIMMAVLLSLLSDRLIIGWSTALDQCRPRVISNQL